MPPRVVIVGAGVAGLAAGHRILALEPRTELTILEAGDRVGGVLRTESQGGYLCEHAANGFLAGAEGGAAALCRELGVDVVTAAPTARRRWVFRRGALRQVPLSPPALLTSDILSWRGRLRLLAEPFARKPPAHEESVAEFGRRRLGAEATEALVAPFVLGVWAGDAEQLSLPAAFPRIAALESGHGGLLRGMLAGRRARRKPPMLSAPRRGMESIPLALAGVLGDAVRTGSRVVRLERHEGAWQVMLGDGHALTVDKVVLAVPPISAADLVQPHNPPFADELRAIPMVAALVAHVGLPLTSITRSLDGFGFLVAQGETPRCLGCVFESSIWPDRAPSGQMLLRFIYGGARDPGVVDLDDGAVAAVIRADLRTALGIGAQPDFLRVVRWPRAIPQYGLGHLQRVAGLERHARSLDLVLSGSGYHGVSINELVDDAARVAVAVLKS